jgi:hypothetical protein
MTKAEARQIIESLGLPEAQVRSARRTIVRATASDDLEVHPQPSGAILITRSRPGRDGKQVFEDTIQADGTKQVVQKAYDAAGNLVHHDPKGGTP